MARLPDGGHISAAFAERRDGIVDCAGPGAPFERQPVASVGLLPTQVIGRFGIERQTVQAEDDGLDTRGRAVRPVAGFGSVWQ